MRVVVTVLVSLALCGSCSKANKTKQQEPRAVAKDGAAEVAKVGASVDAKARPLVGQLTDEQVQQLFYATVSCTNRASCQARKDLHELGETSAPQVAAAALAIMADPLSRTDQGVGLMSMIFVEDWLLTGPDEVARLRTAHALKDVVARGSTFMRAKAYELLARFYLPGAKRILITEVENPARDAFERHAAAGSLGIALDGDFSLIRRWLRGEHPYHWEAALEMMKAFDELNDGNEPLWNEVRAQLISLGKRSELSGAVVYGLAFYYEFYLEDAPGDAELRAIVERWAKHPDDMAAGQMIKILP